MFIAEEASAPGKEVCFVHVASDVWESGEVSRNPDCLWSIWEGRGALGKHEVLTVTQLLPANQF